MKTYRITGVMSGTSLDGLDIASCSFEKNSAGRWSWDILAAETIPYASAWKKRLQKSMHCRGKDLIAWHIQYGHFIGEQVHSFHRKHKTTGTLLVASHGHTVFHQPDKGYTFQLGHGAAIASAAQCTVVSDLRSMDVALSGQGAPLVPAGDKLLFGDYDCCLNLGGFSNISFDSNGERIAFDICPVNIVINRLVSKAGISQATSRRLGSPASPPKYLTYDPEGRIGRSGNPHEGLLDALNSNPFYRQQGPKSLGYEWVEHHVWPLLERYNLSLEDTLATWYEHIATQIAGPVATGKNTTVLVTGGGAHNSFLLESIQHKIGTSATLHVPEPVLVDFKEAMVFAFLGLLCYKQKTNCLSTVTGAKKDAIGGSIQYY